MIADIAYILFSLSVILVVLILLTKRKIRLSKKMSITESKLENPYTYMVSSTKAKLERDIKRIKRKTGDNTK